MARLRSAYLIKASVALVVATLVAATLVAATLVAATLRQAEAQDLSGAPIKLIVGVAAGDAADVTARLVAQKMSESLRTAVDVENRPGKSFIPALRELAGAPPGSRTLLFMSTSALIAQSLHPDDPVDLTMLTPVTQVATGPVIVAASKSFPVTTLGNVIAYAKTNPHRLVLAAGGGKGSPAYLAIELLKAKTRIDVALLAYEGGGPALDDLLRSHVDGVLDGLPVIGPRAKAGLLMPLAVTSARRWPALPDLPTVMEAGISDYEIDRWYGIVASTHMPAAIAKRLHDEVARIMRLDDIKARFADLGADAVGSTPQELAAFLRAEMAKWAEVVKAANIKIE